MAKIIQAGTSVHLRRIEKKMEDLDQEVAEITIAMKKLLQIAHEIERVQAAHLPVSALTTTEATVLLQELLDKKTSPLLTEDGHSVILKEMKDIPTITRSADAKKPFRFDRSLLNLK